MGCVLCAMQHLMFIMVNVLMFGYLMSVLMVSAPDPAGYVCLSWTRVVWFGVRPRCMARGGWGTGFLSGVGPLGAACWGGRAPARFGRCTARLCVQIGVIAFFVLS